MRITWWPFGKRKEEIRADTEDGMIVESGNLLSAILGKEEIDAQKALEIPTVKACINLISGTISSLPIKLYKKSEKGIEEDTTDRRIFLLNNETGDTLTATQFWRAMLEDYFLGKGGYAYINKAGTETVSLHYVDSVHISIMQNYDPIFKDYDILVMGKRYYPHEFLKILRRTKDGMKSSSIMEENPLMLSVSHASLTYEQNMVKKGGNKRGFLEAQKRLTREAMDALKEAFRNLYSNSKENVVVLNDGVKFKESSNTSVEMQLNENKKTNAIEICKLFGVPPAMINGSPTRQDIDEYIRTCSAIINDIECSLDRDLLQEHEKRNMYWAFDTKELTRGNIKERYEAYKIGLEKNFLQIDEVREKEDMEPMGFDWITLGLDQVLYNPKTGELYTPNTNATQQMDHLQAGLEKRARTRNLIITGPPGAGKTSWAEANKKPGEVILDLDRIKEAMLGSDYYHAQIADDVVEMLWVMRDAIYKKIRMDGNETRVYIITTCADPLKLAVLQKQLNADVKVMVTDRETCRARVAQDETRKEKTVFYRLIDEWYETWEGGGEK